MADRPSYSRRRGFLRWRGCQGGFPALWAITLCLSSPVACEQESAAPQREAPPTPATTRAALEAADAYLQADDPASAETILRALVERAPDNLDAREMYGQVLLRRAATLRELGRGAEALGALRRAYEAYQVAVAIRPDSPGLHQSAGEVAQMAGLSEAALDHYQQAGDLAPHVAKHRLFAAQVQLQAGDFEAAQRSLEQALEIDPDEPLALASLALVAVEQGRTDRVDALIDRARTLDPDSDELRVLHARILRRTDRSKAALELLLALAPEVRTSIRVTREIDAIHVGASDHTAAARAWERCHEAATRDADRAEAAVEAARAWTRAGNAEAARSWLRQAQVAGAGQKQITQIEAELSDAVRREQP